MTINPVDHLGLVRANALRQTRVRPIEDSEEYGWGIDGLMYAIERFDASRGFQFSTYATWCIRGYILRGKEKRKKSRTESYEDISQYKYLRAKPRSGRISDFDRLIANDIFDSSPVMHKGDAINKEVAFDYYFREMTLKQIGEKMGISKERVRQRRDEALERMRQVAGSVV